MSIAFMWAVLIFTQGNNRVCDLEDNQSWDPAHLASHSTTAPPHTDHNIKTHSRQVKAEDPRARTMIEKTILSRTNEHLSSHPRPNPRARGLHLHMAGQAIREPTSTNLHAEDHPANLPQKAERRLYLTDLLWHSQHRANHIMSITHLQYPEVPLSAPRIGI